MQKKKKIRKRKSSNLKRSISKFDLQLVKDGKEFWKNFNPKPTKVNVFDEARSIKSWDQLRYILEAYAPAVAYPSTVAEIILKHVKDNWKYYQILGEPDNYGALAQLINFVSRVGAARAYKSQHLRVFCRWTGYEKPKKLDTFKNHITEFKDFLGVKRIHKTYNKLTYTKEELEYEKKQLEKLKDPNFWRFGKKL